MVVYIRPLYRQLYLARSHYRPVILLLVLSRFPTVGSVIGLCRLDWMVPGDHMVHVHQNRQAHRTLPPSPCRYLLPAGLDDLRILPWFHQNQGSVDMERGKTGRRNWTLQLLIRIADVMGQPCRWRYRQQRAYDSQGHSCRSHDESHSQHASSRSLQKRSACFERTRRASDIKDGSIFRKVAFICVPHGGRCGLSLLDENSDTLFYFLVSRPFGRLAFGGLDERVPQNRFGWRVKQNGPSQKFCFLKD